MRILLLGGASDTGARLARHLLSRDHAVGVTSRDPARAGSRQDTPTALPIIGYDHALGEPAAEVRARFARALGGPPQVVVNMIGSWLKDPRQAVVGSTTALLEWVEPGARVVHCSATSVYGDRPGEILDADSATSPIFEIGRVQLEAEELIARAPRVRAISLRIPHIYGPGRERVVARMARGAFVVAGDGTNPMHHVHVTDLIRALAAAIEAPASVDGQIVDVVDDGGAYGEYCDFITRWAGRAPLPRLTLEQARRTRYFARTLGPHFEAPGVLEEFWAYMTSSAQIRNAALGDTLGVELLYPSFRDGLPGVLRHDVLGEEGSG